MFLCQCVGALVCSHHGLEADMAEHEEEYDLTSYTALIGLAEYFRTCQPPKIRECIHCLQASLNIGLPPILDAKVRLNIGKLLLLQTNNLGHARSHLQQTVRDTFTSQLTCF